VPSVLKPAGTVQIISKVSKPYDDWHLPELLDPSGDLTESSQHAFDASLYPGYVVVSTSGRSQKVKDGPTVVYEFQRRIPSAPPISPASPSVRPATAIPTSSSPRKTLSTPTTPTSAGKRPSRRAAATHGICKKRTPLPRWWALLSLTWRSASQVKSKARRGTRVKAATDSLSSSEHPT